MQAHNIAAIFLYTPLQKKIYHSKTCKCLPLYPEERKITAADAMLAIKSDASVNRIRILCISIDLVFSDDNVIAFSITALTKWWVSPFLGFVVKQSLENLYFPVTQIPGNSNWLSQLFAGCNYHNQATKWNDDYKLVVEMSTGRSSYWTVSNEHLTP